MNGQCIDSLLKHVDVDALFTVEQHRLMEHLRHRYLQVLKEGHNCAIGHLPTPWLLTNGLLAASMRCMGNGLNGLELHDVGYLCADALLTQLTD